MKIIFTWSKHPFDSVRCPDGQPGWISFERNSGWRGGALNLHWVNLRREGMAPPLKEIPNGGGVPSSHTGPAHAVRAQRVCAELTPFGKGKGFLFFLWYPSISFATQGFFSGLTISRDTGYLEFLLRNPYQNRLMTLYSPLLKPAGME